MSGIEWTDKPRQLTENEKNNILYAMRTATSPRLVGIKLHRQITKSTLSAAVRVIDALMAAYEL